jgi:hypothetical protein
LIRLEPSSSFTSTWGVASDSRSNYSLRSSRPKQ